MTERNETERPQPSRREKAEQALVGLLERADNASRTHRGGLWGAIAEAAGRSLQRTAQKAGERIGEVGQAVGEAADRTVQKATQTQEALDRLIAKSAAGPAGWILQGYNFLIAPHRNLFDRLQIDATNQQELTNLAEAMGGMTQAELTILQSLMSAEILRQVHSSGVDALVNGLAPTLIEQVFSSLQTPQLPAPDSNQPGTGLVRGIVTRENAQKATQLAGTYVQSRIQEAVTKFEDGAESLIMSNEQIPSEERQKIQRELPAMKQAAQDFIAIVAPSLTRLTTLTDPQQYLGVFKGHRDQVLQVATTFKETRGAIPADPSLLP